jgi:hypothetical protein
VSALQRRLVLLGLGGVRRELGIEVGDTGLGLVGGVLGGLWRDRIYFFLPFLSFFLSFFDFFAIGTSLRWHPGRSRRPFHAATCRAAATPKRWGATAAAGPD